MGEMVKAVAKKPEAKRENKVPKTQKKCPSQSFSSPVEQMLFLQMSHGVFYYKIFWVSRGRLLTTINRI